MDLIVFPWKNRNLNGVKCKFSAKRRLSISSLVKKLRCERFDILFGGELSRNSWVASDMTNNKMFNLANLKLWNSIVRILWNHKWWVMGVCKLGWVPGRCTFLTCLLKFSRDYVVFGVVVSDFVLGFPVQRMSVCSIIVQLLSNDGSQALKLVDLRNLKFLMVLDIFLVGEESWNSKREFV